MTAKGDIRIVHSGNSISFKMPIGMEQVASTSYRPLSLIGGRPNAIEELPTPRGKPLIQLERIARRRQRTPVRLDVTCSGLLAYGHAERQRRRPTAVSGSPQAGSQIYDALAPAFRHAADPLRPLVFAVELEQQIPLQVFIVLVMVVACTRPMFVGRRLFGCPREPIAERHAVIDPIPQVRLLRAFRRPGVTQVSVPSERGQLAANRHAGKGPPGAAARLVLGAEALAFFVALVRRARRQKGAETQRGRAATAVLPEAPVPGKADIAESRRVAQFMHPGGSAGVYVGLLETASLHIGQRSRQRNAIIEPVGDGERGRPKIAQAVHVTALRGGLCL